MTSEIIHTGRLILRPWTDADAPALYRYACDAEVADPAGWPAHTSEQMSLQVIREVFSLPHTFAVVLKSTGEPVGCCGIVPPQARDNVRTGGCEAELGYWIGRQHWGQGYIPEAVEALASYCFDELHMRRLWISHYDHNDKSRRVAEKCGFRYHHTETCGDSVEVFHMRENTDGL